MVEQAYMSTVKTPGTGPAHSFAVCAYGESPYLEACLRSLKAQTVKEGTEILICTSTPNSHISRLAEKYGADVEKARVAALLHDCTKKLNLREQLALCEQYGIALDYLERHTLKLLHAKTGAALAREVFGADEAVCGAIRWHTTGRAGMTLLEKVVYLADYIEPNRNFEGVDKLRAAVYEDLDKGLELGLRMSIEEIEARGVPVHQNTRAAYEYLKGI